MVASEWRGSRSARTVWSRWDGGAARAGERCRGLAAVRWEKKVVVDSSPIRLRNHGTLRLATCWLLRCRTLSVSSKRHRMARKIE